MFVYSITVCVLQGSLTLQQQQLLHYLQQQQQQAITAVQQATSQVWHSYVFSHIVLLRQAGSDCTDGPIVDTV